MKILVPIKYLLPGFPQVWVKSKKSNATLATYSNHFLSFHLVCPPAILVNPSILDARNYLAWEKVFDLISISCIKSRIWNINSYTHTTCTKSTCWNLSLKSVRCYLNSISQIKTSFSYCPNLGNRFCTTLNSKYLWVNLQSEKFLSISGWVCLHTSFSQSNTSFSHSPDFHQIENFLANFLNPWPWLFSFS